METESGIPLHLQLQEIIRCEIESGALPVHSMVPTENEVIAHFGVARYTVRQAYQALVNVGLLERIRGKGTFVLARTEGSSTATNRDCESVVLLAPQNYGEGDHGILIYNLISAVQERDTTASVCLIGRSLKLTLRSLDRALQQNVSGAIIVPRWGGEQVQASNHKICDFLREKKLPLAIVDIPLRGVEAPSVSSDNLQGGRLLGQHLREMGHKRVLVVDDAGNPPSEDRAQGLAEGLGATPNVMLYYKDIEGDFERKMSAELGRPEKPTAVFGVHDKVACQVLAFLEQQSVRVPDTISVVGYDNLSYCQHLRVPLTTIHQPFAQICSEAVDLLTDQIQSRSHRPTALRLPVRLVERSSVRDMRVRSTAPDSQEDLAERI